MALADFEKQDMWDTCHFFFTSQSMLQLVAPGGMKWDFDLQPEYQRYFRELDSGQMKCCLRHTVLRGWAGPVHESTGVSWQRQSALYAAAPPAPVACSGPAPSGDSLSTRSEVFCRQLIDHSSSCYLIVPRAATCRHAHVQAGARMRRDKIRYSTQLVKQYGLLLVPQTGNEKHRVRQ